MVLFVSPSYLLCLGKILTSMISGTVPVKDVGINDGAEGKVVLRFDMPWLTFNEGRHLDDKI